MHIDRQWIQPRVAAIAASILLAASFSTTAMAEEPEVADVTDDGTVNILDISTYVPLLGVNAGEHDYRDGLDIVPDGQINFGDLMKIIGRFGMTGIDTTPTAVQGRVFDGVGNPLPMVKVSITKEDSGKAPVQMGYTDKKGRYSIPIPSGKTGQKLITFDGAKAVDPSPDLKSGFYPTIPNKPIFVNGGTDNHFRDMSLPERDLTGSVDLSQNNVATMVGENSWQLNSNVDIMNAGVLLNVGEGCTATFPAGEDPVLSITRVNPAMLPVPMPPGLSSTIFVTYQPGGTEINCDNGGLFTSFDNVDGFTEAQPPFLAGITNGVFTPLVDCTVDAATQKVNCGPIPLPFDFAWYHVDIPVTPCPRTTVVGTVRLNDGPMTPVAGATVSVPGTVPATTFPDGSFRIPNVPAGPNGRFCFSNTFSLRASAVLGGDLGVSGFTPAVPGGATDVGDIKFGISGIVQGRTKKLASVDPFKVKDLPKTEIKVDSLGFPDCCTITDQNGGYSVFGVPSGAYNVEARFFGEVKTPKGEPKFINLRDHRAGNIPFDDAVRVEDFRFTGTGAVRVRLVDQAGDPVPFVNVQLQALGGDLGAGFVAPRAECFEFAGSDGVATFSSSNFSCFTPSTEARGGVSAGACEIRAIDFDESENQIVIGSLGPEDGCLLNQIGEVLNLTMETQPPEPD